MVLVAPTAFKGTLTATQVAQAIADGVRDARGDVAVTLMPLSDGGNGLIEALTARHGGTLRTIRVTGPLGDPVHARVLLIGREVSIESADACGLHLVPPERRDPLRTSTRGVGELIAATASTADSLRIGLGGSATVDGGAGMAVALGWRLLDSRGRPVPDGGAGLLRLHAIAPPQPPLCLPPALALVDVLNPLLGPRGAARVFAPQKGASPAEADRLEEALGRLALRLQHDVGIDVAALPGAGGVPGAGAGAAGGLGAGLVAFLGAKLVAGSELVLREVGFDAALERAELLVTGEGSYDAQSAMGKVVAEALGRAARARVPALLVAGRVAAAPPPGVTALHGRGRIVTAAWIRREVARVLPSL